VIIDECQDMTPLYFEIVLRILYHHSKNNSKNSPSNLSPNMFPKMVVMGDAKQSIFQFNRADSRFLTEASHIFPIVEGKWTVRSLKTTFRLTPSMTEFLGECCEGAPQMIPFLSSSISTRPSFPVHYMVCNSFSKSPFHQIQKLLKKYAYDDVFILAPSVKSPMTPARKLANLLTEHGVPVFVPTSDEDSLDEDVLRGKVVFSTFHQVKGLERKVVMVFQFDESYMQYFAKDIPLSEHHMIPNTLYVALTRAKEHLILIHDKKHSFLSFVNKSNVMSSRHVRMDVIGGGKGMESSSSQRFPSLDKMNMENNNKPPEKLSVLELVKYTPADILQLCMEKLNVKECLEKNTAHPHDHFLSLSLPTKSQQGEGYENVAEITNVAIPMYFEYLQTGKRRVLHKHHVFSDKNNKNTSMSVPELLKHATEWCCEKSGYSFKQNQIIDYSWLQPTELTHACTHLSEMIESIENDKNMSSRMEYEKLVEKSWEGTTLFGYMDMVSPTSLYEIKIQKEVDMIHFLQCALYLWLNERPSACQHPFSMFSYIPRPSPSPSPSSKTQRCFLYLLHVPTHKVYSVSFLTETSGDEILRILWDYKYNKERKERKEMKDGCPSSSIYSPDPFIQRCKEMWVK